MSHSHSLDNFSPDTLNQEEELVSPRALKSFVFRPPCLLNSAPLCHNKYITEVLKIFLFSLRLFNNLKTQKSMLDIACLQWVNNYKILFNIVQCVNNMYSKFKLCQRPIIIHNINKVQINN